MIVTAEEIARAVWSYTPRTLAVGTPAAPTTRAERVAKNIWGYYIRTLSPVEAGRPRWITPSEEVPPWADEQDLLEILRVVARFI